MNKETFLTYSEWNDNFNVNYNLDHKGLSPKEIQNAIDQYILDKEEFRKNNRELKQLIDEIMEENKKLRKDRDWYQNRYDAD